MKHLRNNLSHRLGDDYAFYVRGDGHILECHHCGYPAPLTGIAFSLRGLSEPLPAVSGMHCALCAGFRYSVFEHHGHGGFENPEVRALFWPGGYPVAGAIAAFAANALLDQMGAFDGAERVPYDDSDTSLRYINLDDEVRKEREE